MMRTFKTVRTKDISGVSGTGVVAEGVEFTDGTCVLRWLTDTSSTAIYNSIGELEAIHGHGGNTKIEWDNEPFPTIHIEENPRNDPPYTYILAGTLENVKNELRNRNMNVMHNKIVPLLRDDRNRDISLIGRNIYPGDKVIFGYGTTERMINEFMAQCISRGTKLSDLVML